MYMLSAKHMSDIILRCYDTVLLNFYSITLPSTTR